MSNHDPEALKPDTIYIPVAEIVEAYRRLDLGDSMKVSVSLYPHRSGLDGLAKFTRPPQQAEQSDLIPWEAVKELAEKDALLEECRRAIDEHLIGESVGCCCHPRLGIVCTWHDLLTRIPNPKGKS